MMTKLTLRVDAELVKRAKEEAARRGKSVSQMVAEYFRSLDREESTGAKHNYPPVTTALYGVLRDTGVDEEDHRQHLREKHD